MDTLRTPRAPQATKGGAEDARPSVDEVSRGERRSSITSLSTRHLFDRNRLRQIPRLVHIRSQQIRYVVCEQLQGHDRDDRLQVIGCGRHAKGNRGLGGHLVRVVFFTRSLLKYCTLFCTLERRKGEGQCRVQSVECRGKEGRSEEINNCCELRVASLAARAPVDMAIR